MKKIRSIYFSNTSDEANASWTREVCNELNPIGNNIYNISCGVDTIEYHFNNDFTNVSIVINGYTCITHSVRVTFED